MSHSGQSSCILISGASRGLGAALAEELAGSAVTLVLLGRDSQALTEVAMMCERKGATCHVAVCDLTDRQALHDLAANLENAGLFPGLVISNAGVLEGRAADELIEDGGIARRVLEVNLLAAIELVWLFIPRMISLGRGHILFVASLAAFSPLQDAAAYSASKSALLTYGLSMRAALSRTGVNVQVVCPGYIASPMGLRHNGSRPGELTAKKAAQLICKGLQSGRGVFGFPTTLYLLSRFSLLVPEWLRLWVVSGLRFDVR
jgi:short-subunit dehydrogenase